MHLKLRFTRVKKMAGKLLTSGKVSKRQFSSKTKKFQKNKIKIEKADLIMII